MHWLVRLFSATVVIIAIWYPFMPAGSDSPVYTSRLDVISLVLPPVQVTPRVTTTELPDFAAIVDVEARKKTFFAYLLPAIHEENQRIQQQRVHLLRLKAKMEDGRNLSRQEKLWLDELAELYRVEETHRPAQLARLLRRVDIIPETLILVQAANESGWGTSRFAVEALNFFGQWCWTQGCGLVPLARPQGQIYEVRTFESMESSVRSYIHNLNTHFAYADLRAIRAELRASDDDVSSDPLTAGLLSYSERGEEYIEELNHMIRINRPLIRAVQDNVDS